MKIDVVKLKTILWILAFWRWNFVMLFSNLSGVNASLINILWVAVIVLILIFTMIYSPIILKEGLLTLILMVIFYIFSFLLSYNERGGEYFRNFILYVSLGAIMINQITDPEYAIKVFCYSSLIVFFIFAFLPFTGSLASYNNIAYFGTGMVYGETVITPCFIGMYIFYRKTGNPLLLIVSLVALGLGLVLANRSCALVCSFFVVLYSFWVEKINGKTIAVFSLIAITVITIVFNIEAILTMIINLLNRYQIHSYALTKYRLALINSDDSFFSGRSEILPLAMQYMRKSPIVGIGFGTFFTETGHAYVHNIFLDWFTSLGIAGGSIMAGITGAAVWKTFHVKEDALKEFLCILFCLWFPRLLFSKTFADDIAYWMYLVYAISLIRNRKSFRFVVR